MACTKRIHFYAKGLIESGYEVKIIIPRSKAKNTTLKIPKSGLFESVPFNYSTNSQIRSNSFFVRRISDIIGPIKAAYQCMLDKPDTLLIVSSKLYHLIVFKVVCMLIKCHFFKELNEVPYAKSEAVNTFQRQCMKIRYSLFDGIIVISDKLLNLIKIDLGLKAKVIVVPIINDFSKIPNIEKRDVNKPFILYTGSLLERKDGIMTILKAFAIVSKQVPGLNLYITGNAKSSQDFYAVQMAIDNLKIKPNVHFTGYLRQGELNYLMKQADLLILAKPKNRQNEYNFPTKIGEYLSSGTPILISCVGPSTNFLSDKTEVFYAENNEIDFAMKIRYILEHPEESRKIGINGMNKAMKVFNYKTYCKDLGLFLSMVEFQDKI